MATQLRITFTSGGNLGEDFCLNLDAPRLLGRTHKADVIVNSKDSDVSGRHLEFEPDGEGAVVHCLSKNGLELNGEKVGMDERRPIRKGDEIRMGMHVRIRVDSIGPAGEGGGTAENETFATRAQEATVSSVSVAETLATRGVGEVTSATRASEPSFAGSLVETPVGDAKSIAPTGFAARGATMSDDAETMQDATTGDAETPHSLAPSFSGQDAPSFSGTSEGETQAMVTRAGNMDVIRAITEEKDRVRRFRQRMLTVAVFGALAVLGAVVYWRWPRAERWLSHPQPIGQHFVKDSAGSTRLYVDYPKNQRTRTSDRANGGVDIETMTGKSRTVPFRLSLDVRRDVSELSLSLESSAERELKGLVAQGYVFEAVGTDGGFGFFEWDYPKSCEGGGTQRGVRFCRREFTRSDGAGQWHGILIYFRDSDTAYRLLREIPDPEWPRGQWLLREDPNLALYAGFLSKQWESPGAQALADYSRREPTALIKAVDASLERNLPNEWKETAHMIDALLLAGIRGDAALRAEATARLERLRKAKRLFYDECTARRDCGDSEEARVRCWGAFGNDNGDLRCRRLSNPDVWKVKR